MTGELPPLLVAVLGVGTDLGLRTTLRHIVEGAADLTGAHRATLVPRDPRRDGLDDIRAVRATRPPGVPAGAPAGEPSPPASLHVPVRVRDEEFGELRLTRERGGGPFTDEDGQLVRLLASQAGAAIANARLYEAARARERWVEGAAAATTALLSGEADDALATVAERARVLADAAAGLILQPTGEGGMRIVTAAMPVGPDDVVGTTIAPDAAMLDQLLGGEPVFTDDAATDPRATTRASSLFGPGMMLPLRAGGRLIGTLALARARGGRPYTALERHLATQFASQAALALVLADARRGRQRLAVYEDHDRIARDLHDLVVQRLFATGMILESAQRRSPPGEVHDTVGRAVDELQSTVQEVRTAIFALQQPPAGAPASLRGRVLRETANAAALLGFPPSTRFTGPVDHRVPDETATRLLTALRQALAAASRRRGVTRVEVTVDATDALPDGRDAVRLTVRDDGTGGSGSAAAGTGVTRRWPL